MLLLAQSWHEENWLTWLVLFCKFFWKVRNRDHFNLPTCILFGRTYLSLLLCWLIDVNCCRVGLDVGQQWPVVELIVKLKRVRIFSVNWQLVNSADENDEPDSLVCQLVITLIKTNFDRSNKRENGKNNSRPEYSKNVDEFLFFCQSASKPQKSLHSLWMSVWIWISQNSFCSLSMFNFVFKNLSTLLSIHYFFLTISICLSVQVIFLSKQIQLNPPHFSLTTTFPPNSAKVCCARIPWHSRVLKQSTLNNHWRPFPFLRHSLSICDA